MAREQDDQTQQQKLLAALLGAPPAPQMAAAADTSDDDDEDTKPSPAPAPPSTPYPLISQGAPPNWLAGRLAGGVAPPPGGRPPLPAAPPPPAAGAPTGGGPLGDLFGVLTSPLTGLARSIGIGGPPPAINLPAPSVAPVGAPLAGAPGAARNIAGQPSDIGAAGGGDPMTAQYQQAHAYEVGEYNRLMGLATQAQAAGRDPSVLVKAADDAGRRADAINDKFLDYQKSTHPVTVTAGQHVWNPATQKYEQPVPEETKTNAPNDEERARLVKAGLNPDLYESKDGSLQLIGGGKGEESKAQRVGTDAYGNEIYATPPPIGSPPGTPWKRVTLEGEPAAVAGTAAAAAGTVDNETAEGAESQPRMPLRPDQQARLDQLRQTNPNPAVAAHVAAILDGRETMPKVPAGGRMNPISQAITAGVYAVDPNFDAANNINQVGTRKAYAPGPNNNAPGTLIQNGDAALDHLAELKAASDKLANWGSVGGAIISGAANVTGGTIGHDYSVARSELDTKAQIAAAEAIKYLAGATGGGEAERDRLMQQFSSSTPPDSRVAAMRGLAQDILQKKAELQAGWHRSMDAPGRPAPDFEVISDNSRKSVGKLGLDMTGIPLGTPAGQGRSTGGQPVQPGVPPAAGGWSQSRKISK